MILHGIEYQRPTSLNMRILADHVTYSFLAFMKSIFHFCLGCYCGGYSQNGRSNLSSCLCTRLRSINTFSVLLLPFRKPPLYSSVYKNETVIDSSLKYFCKYWQHSYSMVILTFMTDHKLVHLMKLFQVLFIDCNDHFWMHSLFSPKYCKVIV